MTDDTPRKQWSPFWLVLAALAVAAVVGPLCYFSFRSLAASVRSFRSPPGSAAVAASRPRASPFDMSNLQVPEDQILSGGPAKDGIPSLTNPKTVAVADAGFMGPSERVVAVTVGGETRAYPIKILNYHELVNDELGGKSIAVIYCPLCDSVSVVDRQLGDTVYEFGISGLLCYSNVLMYDRTDQALWSQVGFKAVSGPNAGQSLHHLAGWELMKFGQFRQAHPGGTIVSLQTGHMRAYNGNPYAGYFTNDEVVPRFKQFSVDRRMKNKVRVIGIQLGDMARAYPLERIGHAPGGTIEDPLGGSTVKIAYNAATQRVSVLESPPGANVVHTFWFAWAKFHPHTEIYE